MRCCKKLFQGSAWETAEGDSADDASAQEAASLRRWGAAGAPPGATPLSAVSVATLEGGAPGAARPAAPSVEGPRAPARARVRTPRLAAPRTWPARAALHAGDGEAAGMLEEAVSGREPQHRAEGVQSKGDCGVGFFNVKCVLELIS